MNDHAVLRRFDSSRNEAVQLRRHRLQAICLLDTQLRRTRDDGIACGKERRDGENRYLVDEPRDDSTAEGCAAKRGASHADVGKRFAAALALVGKRDVRAHGGKHVEDARSCRIDADVFEQDVAPFDE